MSELDASLDVYSKPAEKLRLRSTHVRLGGMTHLIMPGSTTNQCTREDKWLLPPSQRLENMTVSVISQTLEHVSICNTEFHVSGRGHLSLSLVLRGRHEM